MVSGSWPKSETLSQCFTLVRWFHQHGADWSGTPTELAFTIATTGEGPAWFRSSDELVKFIETNCDMLRDLGLAATVRREVGRITIDFKSNNLGQVMPTTGPTDLSTHLAAIEAKLNQQTSAETVIPAPPAPPQKPIVDLGARLHDLIDEDADKSTPYEPAKVETPQVREAPKIEAKPVRKNTSFVAVAGVAIVLVLAGLVWSRTRTAPTPRPSVPTTQKPPETAPAVATSTPPPAEVTPQPQPQPVATPAASTENLDPAERQKFDAILAAATTGKLPAPQYELGMRYAQGTGVAKDNAQAFVWLTLAEVNGSAEATSALQVVQPNLSHDEMQRARIAIANAFTSGVVVNKNDVQAYRWIMKAERDGSPEAVNFRKGLEVRMFAWQIIQAGGTPPVPIKKR
jgi:hypothetical protein